MLTAYKTVKMDESGQVFKSLLFRKTRHLFEQKLSLLMQNEFFYEIQSF